MRRAVNHPHFRIWTGVLLMAGLVALYAAWREGSLATFAMRGRSAVVAVESALAALEADPSAWQDDTRRLLRAATVTAEAAELDTAEALYVRAQQYAREQDFSLAERTYRQAIARRPEWAPPYVGLGTLLGAHTESQVEEAMRLFERAIALAPEWSRPHNSLAIVLRFAGRMEEAEAAAKRALELEPNSVATQNNYGNLLMELGRYDEAEAIYQRAVAANPQHPKPLYNLACLYSRRGDAAAAVAMLGRAIAISPVFREEARVDDDFLPIRGDEGFRALLNPPA